VEEFTQSANINEKWLTNIYENIKKLEDYERLVREGCSSLLDFVQIPLSNRSSIVGQTQFKNLRFLITEFKLLLADLTPILEEDKVKEFDRFLNNIDKAISHEKLFLNSSYDVNRTLIETKPTEFFYQTIETIHKLKVDLFRQIKGILYIKSQNEY
jgi:hypothetical protein